MITFYTCTQITSEVYAAYLKYSPGGDPCKLQELLAVVLCIKYGKIIIYPARPSLNTRHLREFGSTDPQSAYGDSNILVSVEEFFSQLFILELEQ